MAAAIQSDERVEDLSQRTTTTQVFANPDGSWTAEEATGPVRAIDESTGEWAPIDTTLVETSGGFAPANALGGLEMSGGGDKTFAELEVEGRDLAWNWPSVLPDPEIEGSTATYRDVVDNGDLVVTATATGFRHDIVLHGAPDGPVSFSMPVITGGPKITEDSADGTLAVTASDGEELVTAPQPVMHDASTDAFGDPEELLPVNAAVKQTAGGATLTLTPELDFLLDPETEYPVTVDPSWSASPMRDTYVAKTTPTTSYGGTQELRVGTHDGGTHVARSFMQFNTSNAPWVGEQITSASLILRNFDTNVCAGDPVIVHRVTQSWLADTMTWNNQPAATSAGYSQSTVGRGKDACPAADVAWSMTSIVQAWANGTANYGIRVRGVDETSNKTWRRYRAANAPDFKPRLSVTFNRPPALVPGSGARFWPGGMDFTDSLTPQLSVRASDPDGDSVSVAFRALSSTGAELWNSGPINTASGAMAVSTIPAELLVAGEKYKFDVTARDGN